MPLADLFAPPDMSSQYNTQLTPVGQALFQQQMAGRQADMQDYDLQGAWAQQGGGPAGAGHMPDTFKKPNHPTFSTGSMYAGDGNQAGTWVQMPDGAWTFTPGTTNLSTFGLVNLRKYMADREPGNYLVEPPP